jgi:hypothetical protein
MFSIIDNEIRVNFEILGGMFAVATNTGSSVAQPAAGTPIASAEEWATFAQGMTPAQLQAIITELSTSSDNDVLALVKEMKNAATASKGGSLDNALSKDIQYPLIGGAVDPIMLRWFLLPAVVRAAHPLMNAAMLAKANAPNSNDAAWMPNSNAPGVFSANTKRNPVDGVLQVKVTRAGKEELISLAEYYADNSDGAGMGGREGRAAGFKFADHEDKFACFRQGETMWNDNGTAAKPECSNAIKNPALWKTTHTDIAKMSPEVVFNILKSLGFKGEQTSKGVVCQSYDSWRAKLNSDQKTALGFNSNQFPNAQFVSNLVAFMNANPAILNKKSADPTGKDAYGVHAATFNKRVDHSLDDLRYRINSAYDTVRWRFNGLYGALPGNFRLFTGGAVPAYLFPANSSQSVENIPKFSEQLYRVYKSYENRLKAQKKTLSDATKKDIEAIFDSLKAKEQSAVVLIKQLEAYNNTNKLTGNRNPEEVSQKAMDEAYSNFDSLMNKMRKRAINLVDIQAVLGQAVLDAETVHSTFGNVN